MLLKSARHYFFAAATCDGWTASPTWLPHALRSYVTTAAISVLESVFFHGTMAVAGGMYDVVLVVGADKVRETSTRSTFWDWMGMTRDAAWDFPLGLVAPANFALHAARYLYESPTATREHLAMVAVKNHHHGVTNPKAQMRFEITIEQVLNAPMVVEPFGLYDCTPQSDGAAAVLLVAEELADDGQAHRSSRADAREGVGAGAVGGTDHDERVRASQRDRDVRRDLVVTER